ncbi:hypothetical protein ACSNOB_14575 [Micromonospora sp. URMC 106]|uniref:hypothetical protein n=1 Tax=Micromonospora sp. URMC 106 TaxID=3423408 RepID=UPI003F1C468A
MAPARATTTRGLPAVPCLRRERRTEKSGRACHKLDPAKRVYVGQARMTDGILVPEPWEIGIRLSGITPRSR